MMDSPDSIDISIPQPEETPPPAPAAAVGPTVIVSPPTPPPDEGWREEVAELRARVERLESQPEPEPIIEPPILDEIQDDLEDLQDDLAVEIPEVPEMPEVPEISEEDLIVEGMPSELRDAAEATAVAEEVAGEVPQSSALVEGTLPDGPPRRDHWSVGSFPFRRS